MSMGVRYTRGFLLDLKRRLTFVRDAHELLEMKRDQLVRELTEAIEKFKEMRKKLEKEVEELHRELAMVHATYGSQEILSSSGLLKESLELEVIPKSIMGVMVQELKSRRSQNRRKHAPHISLSSLEWLRPQYVILLSLQSLRRLSSGSPRISERRTYG